MCSSHRPTAGADSAPIDTLDRGCTNPGCFATWTAGETHHCEAERPFRALVETYDGDRFYLTVNAIGPRGAEGTARQMASDRGHDVAAVLRVEEAAA